MDSNGLLTCSRYAFPPNSLHYCGPEKQTNLLAYQQEQKTDQGLVEIIRDFQTLYPYLLLIAHENDIADPFDPHVVEAYWIGNGLLQNVKINHFYHHLHDSLGLKKKVKQKDLELLYGKLPSGLLPHHTFHVLNIFTRTGHHAVEHTLDTMDGCRIGWGKVIHGIRNIEHGTKKIRHPELARLAESKRVSESIFVETQPLVLENGKLALGKSIIKEVELAIHLDPKPYTLNPGTYISFHWGTFCDSLTVQQVKNLEHYTKQAIQLANMNI